MGMSAGSAGSTPTIYPGAEAADQRVPRPLPSTSPEQRGRPRSACKGGASPRAPLSERAAGSGGAAREPLGHSLEAGGLREVPPLPLRPCTHRIHKHAAVPAVDTILPGEPLSHGLRPVGTQEVY